MRTLRLGLMFFTPLVLCVATLSSAEVRHLAWTRQLPQRQPMWAYNRGYPIDRVATVVEAGDLLLVGCTADGTVRAYRRADGSEAWRFAFDGAVRWTPSVAGDAVFAGSDDGTVACLNLSDGSLRWRYRPGVGTRQCIGHERLQSSWPIATSIAVENGVAYGGCGYFIDDGIWVFAIDAKTGEERWLRRQLSDRIGGRVVVRGDNVALARLRSGCDDTEDLPIVFDIANGDRRFATDDKGKAAPLGIKVPMPARSPLLRLTRGDGNAFAVNEAVQSFDVAAAIAASAATPISLPVAWQRFGPIEQNDSLADAPTGDAWDGVKASTHELREGGLLNISEVWGKAAAQPGFAAPQGVECLLTSEFTLPTASTVYLNASADWYLRVQIDGQVLIDTLETGNSGPADKVGSQSNTIALATGLHRISVRTRPGRAGYSVRLLMASSTPEAMEPYLSKARPRPPVDPTGGPGAVSQCLPPVDAATGVLVLATTGHRLIGFTRDAVTTPPALFEPEAGPASPHPLASVIHGGWALVAGLGDGALVEALARGGGASHLVAVDADPARTAAVRKRLMNAGLMSQGRVQVLTLDPGSDDLPAWCFAFVTTERGTVSNSLTRLLRPFGGTLLLPPKTAAAAVINNHDDLAVVTLGDAKAVRRTGLATGHSTWSHDMADAANSSGVVETDLHFPLGVHWYGSPADSMDNFMVPVEGTQEGQVPQPQAHLLAKGVWIQQGIGRVVAFDQYTGRLLWKQTLPAWYPFAGLGIHGGKHSGPWDDPISNEMPVTSRDMCRSGGFNMSCSTNELFIAAARELRVYNLETGTLRAAWKIPPELGDLRWGHLRVDDRVVVASLFSAEDLSRAQAGWDGNGGSYSKDRQPMRHLVCLDAQTGALRWKVDAARGFVNHGFAMGGGRVYAIDLLSDGVVKGIATTEGSVPPHADKGALRGFDLATGRQLYEVPLPAQLTDIVYDVAHDTVILPSRYGFKLIGDEWKAGDGSEPKKGKGEPAGVLLAIKGADGSEVYRKSEFSYKEPYSLVETRIVQRYGVEVDALTGKRFERRSPVTGVTAFWTVPPGGCTHLISSRSFSANRQNWVDQDNFMVGNLSGDSGCTPTNIPAGGLVNISNAAMPRFGNRAQSATRTLAFREPVTAWANDRCLGLEAAPAPVQVLGLLPGAPGNRADAQGRWWLRMGGSGYVAGQGPKLAKGVEPPEAAGRYEIAEHRFRGAQGLPAWVGAWGQIGPQPLRVPVVFPAGTAALDGLRYRFRFVVAEPDVHVKAGQRVFSIQCDDAVVAEKVDPVALAKAPRAGAVVQAEVVPKGPTVVVTLTAADGSLPPVIGGILVERVP